MQNEVLNTPPVSNIPKNVLKAPPFNTAYPTVAHSYLPVPSSSSKLRSSSNTMPSGTPITPSRKASVSSAGPPAAGLPVRFPSSSQNLSEEDLDPYFINFEASSKELETLLQGNMERSNRRMLTHYSSLAEDLADLGARLNAFSLSEQSPTLATAIEKTGQAADNTFMSTTELCNQLSATYAEPMRESAQFAGVVRSVLKYRVLKRVQEEMTKDELEKKKALLQNRKDQEEQSRRMTATLSSYTAPPSASTTPKKPRRSSESRTSPDPSRQEDEVASIDSDFPPTHGASTPPPSAKVGEPEISPSNHKKSASSGGGFLTNRIFGRISHAFQGVVDSDPIKTRQDLIGKTIEQVKNVGSSGKLVDDTNWLTQLEQAIEVSHDDVKDASAGVLKDLKRFQGEKEEDLRRYLVGLFVLLSNLLTPSQIAFARCHRDWAKRNVESWTEAKKEIENIHIEDVREI
jgi:sorting nexin-41/42